MAGYQKPGISIREVDTPNTAVVLDRPTVVGLIGQARGNEVRSEIIRLVDSDPVVLTGINAVTSPPSTFVVRDINRLNTVYEVGALNDYVVSTDDNGVSSIRRSLYTTIGSREQVVAVMKTTSPSGVVTATTQFNYNQPTDTIVPSNGGTISVTEGAPGATDISIQRAGRYAITTDYTVNNSNGRIARADSAYGSEPADCHIFNGQRVYVTYTTDNGTNQYVDEEVVLNGTTNTALEHESESVDTGSIIICNKSGLGDSASEVIVYTGAQNGNIGVDFEFEFSPSAAAPEAFTMLRNTEGPTTMGVAQNAVNVRVDYKYIPTDYYVPTLFTSFQDVEAKYGPAFNSDGTVANSISAGAYMCFRSGSNEIIAQALFDESEDQTIRLAGDENDPTHWATTLLALRDQNAINVLVPVIGQDTNDETTAAIQSAIVDHINYMQQDNEYVIALFGEDGTENGAVSRNRATTQTLRDHAAILSQQSYPERTVLVGPSSFKMINPVTGKTTIIGGQYVAAALAGVLARDSVQSSMTRKNIPGIIDVAGVRKNETEKNEDAANGLLVVENKNGAVRVRHAITTAIGDPVKRELNAMRSKFFMIESVKRTLDENVVGRVLADGRAPFIVSTNVSGVLEFLKGSGAITGYSAVTATVSPNSPTAMTVRFAYSLPFAINNIEVALSLDTVTGNINAQ